MGLAKFYEVSLKFTLMKTSKVNCFQLNPAVKNVNQKGFTIKKTFIQSRDHAIYLFKLKILGVVVLNEYPI